MHLHKIEVKNFRLLKDVELILDPSASVIVGRNNSGKTSLAELFRRLLSEKAVVFALEDFSLGSHEQFWTALGHFILGEDEAQIRGVLPTIEVTLTINYKEAGTALGQLSDFIIDLDPTCVSARVRIRYEIQSGKIGTFFEGLPIDASSPLPQRRVEFFKSIKSRITDFYAANLTAVDPGDATNVKTLKWQALRGLIGSGFINAQRGLDDNTYRESDVLGKVLEVLFRAAKSPNAAASDQSTANRLEGAVKSIQTEIDNDFTHELNGLLPAFTLFGYPRLVDPKLMTETTLDVEKLLTNYTKVRYSGSDGVHLPESYNGLGTRNLIFILLKLLEFFKAYHAAAVASELNIVFVEEPEAHLHPQMQEVFISKLSEIAALFEETYNTGRPWPVQFVVTTHSSHLANKAPFKTMRYFLAEPDSGVSIWKTKIKDLGKGFDGDLKADEPFLAAYMTLTRCDLLFADKAILVEGAAERILMPKFIEQIDKTRLTGKPGLGSQFVSLLEVGGAYAHNFFKLLAFLELRSLVITDLDSIDAGNSRKSCLVSRGTHSSNGCINKWFAGATLPDLVAKADSAKVSGVWRIAYQVPESTGMPTGRSFEEAFILANKTAFGISSSDQAQLEVEADTKAGEIESKTEFALEQALVRSGWTVPRYIADGLEWLGSQQAAVLTQTTRLALAPTPTP